VRLDLAVDWKEVASVVERGYQMAAEKARPRATRSKKPTAARSVR